MAMSSPQWLKDLVGTVLQEDVVSDHGSILLPKGTLVTEAEVLRVERHVFHLGAQQPTAAPEPYQVMNCVQAIDAVYDQMGDVFQYVTQRERVPLIEVTENILPSILAMIKNLNVSQMLVELHNRSNYTLAHSISVSVLSTSIGRWLHMDEEELEQLALAALLHDIGKMKIPPEILGKPSALTFDEFKLMKKHTVFGYQILLNTPGIFKRQALVAQQHHERIDGSGYPLGLKDAESDMWSRIVGVADVFDAMSSRSAYHDARPLYLILQELHDGVYGKYDTQITRVFLERMMDSLLGQAVSLSDGQKGTIVYINRFEPLRPLIKTATGFVDLSRASTLKIEQLLG